MDIFKKLINFGQLLKIRLEVKDEITIEYYENTLLPVINIIGKHNNIKIRNVRSDPLVIDNELVVYFHKPYFDIVCDHNYYDGKAISYICKQFNVYMETKELLQPIKNIYKEETISKKMFNIVSNNTLSNNLLGSYKIKFVQTFDSSMTSSKIIDYIQKRENKPIIYFRASKSSENKQGNTYNFYYINENQTLKEALSKEQIITTNKIPMLLLKKKYIVVNLYTIFNIPSFTSKMVLKDTAPAIVINLISEKIGIDKSYALMPLSSNNTYDLYVMENNTRYS
jgi:hypothetical protein